MTSPDGRDLNAPTEIAEIVRIAKEKIERLPDQPPGALSPYELTRRVLGMHKVIIALAAQCKILRATVENLKNNHVPIGCVVA
jgi:hypothetical protein